MVIPIYDLTQTVPLVENVRTCQLRFLGRVLYRMPDAEPCKEYALYCIFHHMGRGNQEGNVPCFSVTFNTYWEIQTT